MNRPLPQRWRGAVLALTLTMAITACSSDQTPQQTTEPPTQSTAAPTETTAVTESTPTQATATTGIEPTALPTPIPVQEEASVPDEAMDDIEAEEANRIFARRDLETKATVIPLEDGTFLVEAAMRILDRSNAFHPTIIFTPSDGVQIVDPPAECTTIDNEVRCQLAVFFDQSTIRRDNQFPTDWLPLSLTATINPDVVETPQIAVSAASRENGLDNDPDPTNNTITLELGE